MAREHGVSSFQRTYIAALKLSEEGTLFMGTRGFTDFHAVDLFARIKYYLLPDPSLLFHARLTSLPTDAESSPHESVSKVFCGSISCPLA